MDAPSPAAVALHAHPRRDAVGQHALDLALPLGHLADFDGWPPGVMRW